MRVWLPVVLGLAVPAGCGGDDAPANEADANTGDLACTTPRPGCPPDDCFAGLCPDQFVYDCDPATGAWVEGGVCEAWAGSIDGRIVLFQSVDSADPGCAPVVPRVPLVFDLADDGTLSVDSPGSVTSGYAGPTFGGAALNATLTDDWFGVPVTVAYGLQSAEYTVTSLDGGGHASLGDCELELRAFAIVCPDGATRCDAGDAGWTARCVDGAVRATDRTRYDFCAPGSTTPACGFGGGPTEVTVATCVSGCADETLRTFATTAEYVAFDPRSLCAP